MRVLRDSDGRHRCLPRITTDVTLNGDQIYLFADASCTTPAAYLSRREAADVQPGTYVTAVAEINECGARRQLAVPMRAGEEVDAAYWGEGCSPSSYDSGRFFSAQIADLDVFAAADLVDANGVRSIEADDGAWENLFLLDDDGRSCGPVRDNPPVCMAVPYATEDSWTDCHMDNDLSCSGPTGAVSMPPVPDWCDERPTYAFAGDFHGADLGVQVHVLGAPASELSCVVDNECVRNDELTQYYFEIEDTIPIDQLPALTRVEVGDGPVIATFLGRDDATPLVPADGFYFGDQRWRTTRDDGTCAATRLGDDYWCVPRSARHYGKWYNYADQACSTPLVGSGTPAFVYLTDEALPDDAPGGWVSFHAVEPWTGTVYKDDEFIGCTQVPEQERYDSYHSVGERIDPATVMTRFEVVTE
ncbi:MAG: hypothetical protein JKY37_02445 [Nannocystaceae bacterium]|nr:hypothetical protein [Nannocystaceae bacterium]